MKLKSFWHGILPAMLLSMAVGQIYAFTNFATEISATIDCSLARVQFAFSLGIFFLGMGAAFFGKFVEKDVKGATILGTVLFIAGLLLTQVAVLRHSLGLLYAGYGVLLGLGTGIIYISPVKTMMMWFQHRKAVASSIPIIFFGLGSTLSTFLFPLFMKQGIERVFICYAVFYLLMMGIGALLLAKPEGFSQEVAKGSADFSYLNLLKNRFFVQSWLFMLLNISAGLCLIPLSKQMMNSEMIGYSKGMIITIVALSGVFNGCGRFVFAYLSDCLKKRTNIIYFILGISLVSMLATSIWPLAIGVVLLFINSCYGAGFSVMPGILSDKFGMSDISKIHGAVLSAWGIAGLVGNNLSMMVEGRYGYHAVLWMICGLYLLNILNWLSLGKSACPREDKQNDK